MSQTKSSFLQSNWLLIFAIVYLLLRVDLIPDAIPLFGNLDDAALILINLIQKYTEWKKQEQGDRKDENIQEGEIVE